MRRAPLMPRPGQTESESVPIWLKLSEADAAQMDQVLARPEFAGWTKAEWCLEIIQTALRYYSNRPVAEPGRARRPARPAATEPGLPLPASEPESAAPRPKRAAPKRKPVAAQRKQAAAKRQPVAPEPGRAAAEPDDLKPESVAPEPTAAVPEPPPQAECLHPADARDYQTGTCAACGAILWD
jgi:hypothetical protein